MDGSYFQRTKRVPEQATFFVLVLLAIKKLAETKDVCYVPRFFFVYRALFIELYVEFYVDGDASAGHFSELNIVFFPGFSYVFSRIRFFVVHG